MKDKISHIRLIILSLVLVSITPSCNVFVKKTPPVVVEPVSPFADYTKATVIKYSLDGCNWMLQLEDGKKLEPKNLGDEYSEENLSVWVIYETVKDYSFCMAGDIVNIQKIALRDNNE